MRQIRLFVKNPQLKIGGVVVMEDNDFDYLTKVMRQKIGNEIIVFNGKDGEFMANISAINKRDCQAQVVAKIKEQYFPPQITLAFAPVKNVGIDVIAKKATELGITNFQPIITQHSIVDKINPERFIANIKEAAEQCERLDIPQVQEITKLDSYFKILEKNHVENKAHQILILGDESGNGKSASEILPQIKQEILNLKNDVEIVVFIGPEGGFSKAEFERFYNLEKLYSLNLGPRILRADTAMITAIALTQEFLGDFEKKCRF